MTASWSALRDAGIVRKSRLASPRARRVPNLEFSQIREQQPQFAFGILVMLVDGELQRLFQEGLRFVRPPLRQQKFPEENSCHHPV